MLMGHNMATAAAAQQQHHNRRRHFRSTQHPVLGDKYIFHFRYPDLSPFDFEKVFM